MVALEISVNGRSVQTSTVGECGMIEAHVVWMRFPTHYEHSRVANRGYVFSYGRGREVNEGPTRFETLRWPNSDLHVGDVVTVRVVEVENPTSDPPSIRRKASEATRDY
jgi:hypothetical protein